MLKIMRPKNRIQVNYVVEGIYIAKIWHDISWINRELMTAIIIGNDNMLLEYDILARGTERNVTFEYKELVERGESLGAISIHLLHNHPGIQYAKLSSDDIEIIRNPGKEYEDYKVKVNRIACIGWGTTGYGGQIYGNECGISTYDHNTISGVERHYKTQSLGPENAKKTCIVVADAHSYLKYDTDAKMKEAQKRLNIIAEETKHDADMYTITKLDRFFKRKKRIHYGYPLPEQINSNKETLKTKENIKIKPSNVIQLS